MVGAGQLFGANANTWKIGAGLCLGGMIIEFLSFSSFSLVVLHFGYRYRQNKESIPDPDYRVPIVDRILVALYINMGGQFVPLHTRRWLTIRFALRFEWLNSADTSTAISSSQKFINTASMHSRFSSVSSRSASSFPGNSITPKPSAMS